MNRREFHAAILKAATALVTIPASTRALAESPTGTHSAHAQEMVHAMMKLMQDLAQGDPAKLEAMHPEKPRHIAMLAYPGMFPLDFFGPHEVFTNLMNTRIHVVSKSDEPIGGNAIKVFPNATFEDCPRELDVLFVPGGLDGTAAAMKDRETLNFLRRRAKNSKYVTSVCTGALVLGAAGLLKGKKATTYWAVRDLLAGMGATPVVARYVEDGKYLTGGGVTAGIDMALLIAARLASENYAKAVQLYLEYDPQPPFNSGSPETAEPFVTEAILGMFAGGIESLRDAGRS